jgi:hypothetical protein
VAVAWVPAVIADAHSVAIPCLIKSACPVSSKPVPNAGLKWRDPEREKRFVIVFKTFLGGEKGKWVEIEGETCII